MTNPWLATFTRRWHTNPHLRDTQDCVGGHSGRVALILMMLEPEISRGALKMAILHDLGEASCGDVAAPFKWANPDFAERLKEFEAAAIGRMGFGLPELTIRESRLISIADALDAYLWARFHRPRLVSGTWGRVLARLGFRRNEWADMYTGILAKADRCGVRGKVKKIVQEVSLGKF